MATRFSRQGYRMIAAVLMLSGFSVPSAYAQDPPRGGLLAPSTSTMLRSAPLDATKANAGPTLSLGSFTFDTRQFGDSLGESDGGTFRSDNWLNIVNSNPGNPSALTGPNFDTGVANIGLGSQPVYTIRYNTPIVNGADADLGIITARYSLRDTFRLAVSTDGTTFTPFVAFGPELAVSTGVARSYFYRGSTTNSSVLFVTPVDLSAFGLASGASISALMVTSGPEGDLVRIAGFQRGEPDSDHDGVSDGPDLCPGTPPGRDVDPSGCLTPPSTPTGFSGTWAISHLLADYNIALRWNAPPSGQAVTRYDIYARRFDPDVDVSCDWTDVPWWFTSICFPSSSFNLYEWKLIVTTDGTQNSAFLADVLTHLKELGLPVSMAGVGVAFRVQAGNDVGSSEASEPFFLSFVGGLPWESAPQVELQQLSSPLVFVPGWHGGLGTWKGTTDALRSRFNWDEACQVTIGRPVTPCASNIYRVEFTDSTGHVPVLASELNAFLASLTGRATVVGHSAGGVVARACVQNYLGGTSDCSNRVEHLVTYGSPHRGTPVANIAVTVKEALPDILSSADALSALTKRLPLYGQFVNTAQMKAFVLSLYEALDSLYAGSFLGALGEDMAVGSPVLAGMDDVQRPVTTRYTWIVGRTGLLADILAAAAGSFSPAAALAFSAARDTDFFVPASSQLPQRGVAETERVVERDPFVHAVAFNEGSDYVGVLKALGYRFLTINPGSPVSLSVVDPEGNAITKSLNGIPGAAYSLTGGIEIPNPKTGIYRIMVTSLPGVSADATFSLEAELDGSTVVLADHVRVDQAAPQGYLLTVAAPTGNRPPSPQVDGAGVVEATSPGGALVTLDGSPSFDPDGDKLAYDWKGPFGTTAGAIVGVPLAMGTHMVVLTVDDGQGGRSSRLTFVTVRDSTPPRIACGPPDSVWHSTNVAIACTAFDDAAGLARPADGSFMLMTTVAAGSETTSAMTGGYAVCDLAGNCVNVAPVGPFKVDMKAPAVTVTTPITGGTYALNQSVTASFGCVDSGSGVAACRGSVALGALVDTASVGVKSFTVTANDYTGNLNSVTNSYAVSYASGGACLGAPGHQSLQPINADGTSVFKKGSTVPVKFRVCDANGASIGTPGVVKGFRLVRTMKGTTTPSVNEPADQATPDAAFRWSATDKQWILNLSTTTLAANVTYVYLATLNDGSTIQFQFGLK